MMNLGKGFGAAKVPVLVILALAVFSSLLFAIPVVGSMLICVVGLPMFVINIALYLWLGFLIYKAKLEIVDAALVGGLTGLIASVVRGGISLIVTMLGLGAEMATSTTDLGAIVGAGVGAGVGIIMLLIWAVIGLFVGLVLAAIGYFIGSVLKK